MTEESNINNYIKRLKDYFWRVLILEGVVLGVFVILFLFFRENIRLDTQPALMGKSIFFAIFLIAFPSLLSYFHGQVNKLHLGLSNKTKLERYQKDYRFLNNALFVLFVLTLIAFILTSDPFVLVFLLADLFFIFYERPKTHKIKEILSLVDE